MANSLRLPAFAKINLCLHIMGRRPDGYHELRTIFQTISLHDTLKLSLTRSRGTLETDDPNCRRGPENLVFRAIESIRREIEFHGRNSRAAREANTGGARAGRRIKRRCGRAYRCAAADKKKLPLERLLGIAAGLGADVPFFLFGGRALAVNRGDEIYPLDDAKKQTSWWSRRAKSA